MRQATAATTAPGRPLVRALDRDGLELVAQRILRGAMSRGSAGHAQVTHPGIPGPLGADIDGLEGFARTFLLAAFTVTGARGSDPLGCLDWYAAGLLAGTDPLGSERWPRLDEHPQAKVEAASLAFALDMTRPWLWDRLGPSQRSQVVAYLAPAVGDDSYPQINWVWFRLVVQTFLASVGGPSSEPEMRADLATHDSFAKAHGWLADGDERAFDHYGGWALHTFRALWARMDGARKLAAERGTVDVERLDRYLDDALALVGADGSPLIQGRSLSYRFAAAAPFWAGILSGVPSHAPGVLRRAATAIVGHFDERHVPGEDGILPVGWHRAWPALAQAYTGPGSPYWASKGLMGLVLPADHEAWAAPELPLPIEVADTIRAVVAPGWVVSGTVADGIVRVVNHGTDHAREGEGMGDSPLYSRLGYSTATFPMLDEDSWRRPQDQSVTVLDAEGNATHRAGMALDRCETVGDGEATVGVAASSTSAHWIAPDAVQQHHGSGYSGVVQPAARLRVLSAVRGPWEVRLVRIDEVLDEERAVSVRVSGWALSADDQPEVVASTARASVVRAGSIASMVWSPEDDAVASVVNANDAGPDGVLTTVPVVDLPLEAGRWLVTAVALSGSAAHDLATRPQVTIDHEDLAITWPDGPKSTIPLKP